MVRTADGRLSAALVTEDGRVSLTVRAEDDPGGAVAFVAAQADGVGPEGLAGLLVPLAWRFDAWEGDLNLGPIRAISFTGPVELLAPSALTGTWVAAAVAFSAPRATYRRDELAWEALADAPGLPASVRDAIARFLAGP